MSGKAILTAVSSGTTEMPSPTSTSRNQSRSLVRTGGAGFTAAGTQEMDAAIMEGSERRAGAVAGICGPKNPVLAARAVMEHSPHVLLIGDGALAFCHAQGLTFADRDYFYSETRWRALQRTLERQRRGLAEDATGDDEA